MGWHTSFVFANDYSDRRRFEVLTTTVTGSKLDEKNSDEQVTDFSRIQYAMASYFISIYSEMNSFQSSFSVQDYVRICRLST